MSSGESSTSIVLRIVGTIVGAYYGGVPGAIAGFNISAEVGGALDVSLEPPVAKSQASGEDQ